MMTWSDDVSGNRSKQFNPHTNIYLANLNLPHKQLQQEYFVQFCSTSPTASSSEQISAVAEDSWVNSWVLKDDTDSINGLIRGKDIWHLAYDCIVGEEVLFRIIPHILPADNPQASHTCSHIGLMGNLSCRRCGVGGVWGYKKSEEGYHELFSVSWSFTQMTDILTHDWKPGISRTPDDTLHHIKTQLLAACSGVKDRVEDIQTKTGVKDDIAGHWIDILIVKSWDLQTPHLQNKSIRNSRFNDKNFTGAPWQA